MQYRDDDPRPKPGRGPGRPGHWYEVRMDAWTPMDIIQAVGTVILLPLLIGIIIRYR